MHVLVRVLRTGKPGEDILFNGSSVEADAYAQTLFKDKDVQAVTVYIVKNGRRTPKFQYTRSDLLG